MGGCGLSRNHPVSKGWIYVNLLESSVAATISPSVTAAAAGTITATTTAGAIATTAASATITAATATVVTTTAIITSATTAAATSVITTTRTTATAAATSVLFVGFFNSHFLATDRSVVKCFDSLASFRVIRHVYEPEAFTLPCFPVHHNFREIHCAIQFEHLFQVYIIKIIRKTCNKKLHADRFKR